MDSVSDSKTGESTKRKAMNIKALRLAKTPVAAVRLSNHIIVDKTLITSQYTAHLRFTHHLSQLIGIHKYV